MKDNFSRQADIYAKYRPVYPQKLFDFILKHIAKKQNAWIVLQAMDKLQKC
jgi:hypothetical protein